MPHAGKAVKLIFPFKIKICHQVFREIRLSNLYLADRSQNAPACFAVLIRLILQLDQLMVDGHSRREGGIILMTPDRQCILCLDRRVVSVRCFVHELHALQCCMHIMGRLDARSFLVGNKRALRILQGAR